MAIEKLKFGYKTQIHKLKPYKQPTTENDQTTDAT
jgi:hypothetical protein